MADGVTITGVVDLRRTLDDLFDLPEKEVRSILRACARKAAPEVLTSHYEKGKGSWDPKKDGGEQLVATGRMKQGITAKTAPAALRKITVTKLKKEKNTYRISIGLRKMVHGKNVYNFAQQGRAVSATGKTKHLGRTKTVGLKGLRKSGLRDVKVNRVGVRMVTKNEPGDANFFSDKIEEALRTYMARKAKKAGGR